LCPTATDLLLQVEPSAAWNYLLIINQQDLLKLWADVNISESSSAEAIRSLQVTLDCEATFADKLIYMFKIWDITPEMIEKTTTADCLKCTKEIVLDHLSKFGIFCSTDKTSLTSILIRFVRTRNLANVKSALESPTSVIIWNEFSKMLLKYCTQHKLAPVMFSFLADNQGLEDLVKGCDVSKDLKQWLLSWFSLVKLSKDATTENILEAIEENIYLLADGNVESFLLDQPFITLAMILLGSKDQFVEILSGQSTELKAPLSKELVQSVRRSFPVLDIILTEETWEKSQKPDVSLYELLERGSVFDVSKLFGWQESHK